jgi:cell division septum initiation protein DivIVA
MDNSVGYDVYSALRTATEEIMPLRERAATLQTDIDSGRYSEATMSKDREEIAAIRKQISEKADETLDTVRKTIKQHQEAVLALDDVRGEDLTPDAALLNCGVALTSRDVVKMLERNKGNNTMIQLVTRFAREHNIDTQGYVYRNHGQEAAEMESYNSTASAYMDHWFDSDQNREMLDKFFGVVR